MKPTTIAGILTAGILIIGGIVYKVGDTPPVPVNPIYLGSAEQLLYDTVDGQIHVGEYALQPDGIWYQVYLPDQIITTATSTYTIKAHIDGTTIQPSGTLIHVIGRQYKDVYIDATQKEFDVSTTKASFDAMKVKNPTKPTYPI